MDYKAYTVEVSTDLDEKFQIQMFEPPSASVETESKTKSPKRARKRANDLDGATWIKNSVSIWSDIRKSSEEIQLGHPAIFPMALVTKLLQCFTKREDRVILDPFAGVGSTLLAAKKLGKKGVGIELSPEFIEIAKERAVVLEMMAASLFDTDKPANQNGQFELFQGDARQLPDFVAESTVDMVITSPPYWDILNMKRTADYKEIRNYGDAENDLGKIKVYQEFLQELREVFIQVHAVLKPGRYCVVVVMDIRKKNRFYPFHSDIADFMQDIGFIYDDLIIWDRRHEYNNLRPLGYPSVFRVNKVHETILVFQKPRG